MLFRRQYDLEGDELPATYMGHVEYVWSGQLLAYSDATGEWQGLALTAAFVMVCPD